jgi:hypothetical protein
MELRGEARTERMEVEVDVRESMQWDHDLVSLRCFPGF